MKEVIYIAKYKIEKKFPGNKKPVHMHTKDLNANEIDFLSSSVVSSTECTGLTATIPESYNEAVSYREIYNIPLEPKNKTNTKNQYK